MANEPTRDATDDEVQFLWDRCVNHDHGLMAEADGELDKRLRAILDTGLITHYDSMFGNRYYALTVAGKAAIRPARRTS